MIFPNFVTYHVYDGRRPPPFDAQAYQYILAGEGIFVRSETPFFSALVPVVACSVRGLAGGDDQLLDSVLNGAPHTPPQRGEGCVPHQTEPFDRAAAQNNTIVYERAWDGSPGTPSANSGILRQAL
jgi:hypothetical protein